METKQTIDELLQTPYWMIDFLPKRVTEESTGQYFAVEKYYLSGSRFADIKQKHINVILKLNCYMSISLNEETMTNPPPERIAEEMRKRHLCVMADGAMIVSEPDDTYMTVYNPNEKLLELIKVIAGGEGLFVWKKSISKEI